jgi:hypothetical protein
LNLELVGHHPTSSVWIRRQDARRHNRHSNPGKITMNIVKDNSSEHSHKDIVTKEKKPSRVMIYGDSIIAAKANTHRLCNCPNSEPGKISLDICAHESDCWIRKRLLTKHYTVETSVTPEKFNDGYMLGVVV